MKHEIKQITRDDCEPFVIGIHYAKRWPSISFAYGMFDGDELTGICTFGYPFSNTLKVGIAGEKYSKKVLELNRLCLRYNRKNEASYLVSRAMKMLPKPNIIVSFADTAQNHSGYVYQACNFLYCGLSAKRTDWTVKGKEKLHSTTISGEFRGKKNRAKLMREKYGSDFYLKPRPRKHRYIYINGSNSWKKTILKELKYKTEDYPKSAI